MAQHSTASKKPKGRPVNKADAAALLRDVLEIAETAFRDGTSIQVPEDIAEATERLFSSKTQAYRDAMVSCAIARILDPEIDIRLPATTYGDNAFSGRALADTTVTPFLRSRAIPTSASPFLSALRVRCAV
jgi:hypothetical protein